MKQLHPYMLYGLSDIQLGALIFKTKKKQKAAIGYLQVISVQNPKSLQSASLRIQPISRMNSL